jgi:hypothetical protein
MKVVIVVMAKVMIAVKAMVDEYPAVECGITIGTVVIAGHSRISRHTSRTTGIGRSFVRHRGAATKCKRHHHPA